MTDKSLREFDLKPQGLDYSALVQPEEWTPAALASSLELAKRVQNLQADVPTLPSDSNVAWPTAYIDPALVAKGEVLSAPVPLSYLEGYPTVDGIPFWERLENEPIEYFKLFKAYRDMKDKQTMRSVPELAKQVGRHANVIMRLGALYHWQLRTKAYDYFRNMEIQMYRIREIERVQNDHAATAKSLRGLAMSYLNDNAELMTPKNAIDLMKLAVELERLSVGMSPNKPDTEVAAQRGPTINITNNTLNTPVDAGPAKSNAGNSDRVAQILTVLQKSGAMQQTVDRIEVGEGSDE